MRELSSTMEARAPWYRQKRGLCLRPTEYKRLKEHLPKIRKKNLPTLESVVSCYLHYNIYNIPNVTRMIAGTGE